MRERTPGKALQPLPPATPLLPIPAFCPIERAGGDGAGAWPAFLSGIRMGYGHFVPCAPAARMFAVVTVLPG